MKTHLVFSAIAAASISVVAAGGTECPSDITGDGLVGITDMLQVLADWGCTDCPDSDIDNDGLVGITDFLLVLADWGCEVNVGELTTLSGSVTNLWTADPVVGASVLVGPDEVITDAFGVYTGEFPAGIHDVVFQSEYFVTQTTTIELFLGVPATLDAQLEPVAAVIVNVVVLDDATPGGTVDVMADVVVLDGSTIQGYAWTQTAGAAAGITGADTDTATLNLGTRSEYKEHLCQMLAEPPIDPALLPPYIPPPDGEFVGGLQNRFEIATPNPMMVEEAGLVGLMVDVTTTSGLYPGEGEVHTHIPWRPAGGIRNIPIGIPVLLNGKDQASYDWALTTPDGSTATLIDAATPNPDFTPDLVGLYEVTVTDTGAGAPVTLQIFAGNWRGVIVGQDVDGRPIADSSCTGCHTNLGYDKFTPWAQTGHAEIFTNNLNTSSYYGPQCFACHSVGYDLDAANNGFDDSYGYQDFLDSGLIGNPGDNWTNMLDQFPFAAQLANGQCENCHGPQWGMLGVNTLAHGPVNPQGEPRVSLAATVCATCHGEPLRHARYQQWQFSAHANYELAIERGSSGHCSRCHTANGFLAWLPVLLGDVPGDPTDNVTVTWTPDEVHPQTCVTCHDPHASGNTSGEPNNATVRISGDTPPLLAGFTAFDVGRGAICMTCHNSRRGLRNDSTFDQYYGTSEAVRMPHGSAQADVVMGENAYLVTVGIPGNHSTVADSCATCHMEATPPPAELSYNQGGTNHTFYASTDICGSCHGPSINADAIQSTTHILMDTLQDLIEEGVIDLIAQETGLGHIVDLDGDRQITDVAEIVEIVFGEYRGRQAITVTFTDAVTMGPYRLSDVDVLDGALVLLGELYDFADPNLVKSGWNWGMVDNDGTSGIHNPSFVFGTLSTSIQTLDPSAALAAPWWLSSSAVNQAATVTREN